MGERVEIWVDGRPVRATPGSMLLDVIREMGIDVPTLCHHPSLEPSGSCRLCVVEITHDDWKGWKGLVTACLYPVEEGLLVSTRSDKVLATRKTLLEMLLGRCPDAGIVREMAAAEGVTESTFVVHEGADLCVMCGMCTRVCQSFGPAAIAPLGRGAAKEVGPRPDKVGTDCTGCGACALVCPTGEIEGTRTAGQYAIWNRTFDVPPFAVTANQCIGCGICEEVCPLAIPRVVAYRTGRFVSKISREVCVGCGLCAGACPTAAISSVDGTPARSVPKSNGPGRVAVFACSRSPFPGENGDLIEVPCVGAVSVADMLLHLAGGADGVLVMGRDPGTCAHGIGEKQAEERVRVVETLASLAGLGPGRARFAIPTAGYRGPSELHAEFSRSLGPSPLETAFPVPAGMQGLDLSMAVFRWLLERPELSPGSPAEIGPLFSRGDRDEVGLVGDAVALDLMLSLHRADRLELACANRECGAPALPDGARLEEVEHVKSDHNCLMEYARKLLKTREGAWRTEERST